MGGLEDDDGNLLVLDHPKINFYYEAEIKRTILELLYINGDDCLQRLQYMEKQRDEYRQQAFSVVNVSDYRQMLKTARVNREMNDRRYYAPISRWKGYLGWVNNVDYTG